MDELDFVDALEQPNATLYKLTGPPEHWLTTFNTGFWGLQHKYRSTWAKLQPGDLFLFHSTRPIYIPAKGVKSGAIGVGRLSGKSEKDTLEWYNEIDEGVNGWPLLTHFSDIWWLGRADLVVDEPFAERMARGDEIVARDAMSLTNGGVPFSELRTPDDRGLFSPMGSISRVTKPYAFAEIVRGRRGILKSYVGGEATQTTPVGGEPSGTPGTPGSSSPPGLGSPPASRVSLPENVATGSRPATATVRVGQKKFADAVKANYGNRCCFPDCDVSDPAYLIGAHIVRWTDDEELRGRIDNGLCLCLMHDRAFERGHFTVTRRLQVLTHSAEKGSWAWDHLRESTGGKLRHAGIPPNPEYLALHRERVASGLGIPPEE